VSPDRCLIIRCLRADFARSKHSRRKLSFHCCELARVDLIFGLARGGCGWLLFELMLGALAVVIEIEFASAPASGSHGDFMKY
jgi:hypothetical protein